MSLWPWLRRLASKTLLIITATDCRTLDATARTRTLCAESRTRTLDATARTRTLTKTC